MIRLWGKIIKNNKITASTESTCSDDIDYQDQLKKCIIEICYNLDLQKPYWLPKTSRNTINIKKLHSNRIILLSL